MWLDWDTCDKTSHITCNEGKILLKIINIFFSSGFPNMFAIPLELPTAPRDSHLPKKHNFYRKNARSMANIIFNLWHLEIRLNSKILASKPSSCLKSRCSQFCPIPLTPSHLSPDFILSRSKLGQRYWIKALMLLRFSAPPLGQEGQNACYPKEGGRHTGE